MTEAEPTYARMILEFLATLRKRTSTRTGAKMIVFNLHDQEKKMTYTQLRNVFGVENLNDEDYGNYEHVAFWQLISDIVCAK